MQHTNTRTHWQHLAESRVGVWFQLVFQAATWYLYCQCVCVPVCDTRSCARVCQRDALTHSPDFRSTHWPKRGMGCSTAQHAGQVRRWFSNASLCLTELQYQTEYVHSCLHLWNESDTGILTLKECSILYFNRKLSPIHTTY